MKKQSSRKWKNKEFCLVIEQIKDLFSKANKSFDYKFNGSTLTFVFDTKFDPLFISILEDSFRTGSLKWNNSLKLEISDKSEFQLIFYASVNNISKRFLNASNLAKEIQYKRGMIKLKFEYYYQRTFPTY